jgi:2-polyprenyl-6-methoxyphenol hydroxylase-like FAD-dependent oxidoreductase
VPASRSPHIVIAGDGIAASALACQLLDSGCRVTIAPGKHPRSEAPVIEALPYAAVHLFTETGLGQALSASDPITIDGFDNHFHDTHLLLDGAWIHVDRSALARHCLRAALDRGARLLRDPNRVGRGVLAIVDATGRAARRSRPIQRSRPATATIFTSQPHSEPRPGRVIRTASGWAYRIDHPTATTVGVVTDRHPADIVHTDEVKHLGIDSADIDHHSIRNCSVQWSDDPIGHRRIAIGDAALALNPLAGQGVRFALASTLAAAAVVRSWVDGHDDHYIDEYYRTFIAGVRARHLATLNAMFDGTLPPDPPPRLDPQSPVSFSATAVTTGQNRGGRIVAAQAFQLPDGGLTRYVGGVDLMMLRDATTHSGTLAEAYQALADKIGLQTANTLISWAIREGLLTVSETRCDDHQDPSQAAHLSACRADRLTPTGPHTHTGYGFRL